MSTDGESHQYVNHTTHSERLGRGTDPLTADDWQSCDMKQPGQHTETRGTQHFLTENAKKRDALHPAKHNLRSVVDYTSQDEALYGSQITLHSSPEEQAAPVTLPSSPQPDGGYGWVIVVAAALGNYVFVHMRYTPGLFLPDLKDHFAKSQTDMGLLDSVDSILCNVASKCKYTMVHSARLCIGRGSGSDSSSTE